MDREDRFNSGRGWSRKTGDEDNEALETNIFFTRIRQTGKKAGFLSLQLKGKRYRAFPYGAISEVTYEPPVGIHILLAFGMVKIEGRNLEALYRHLIMEQVTEVREGSDEGEKFFSGDALIVTQISYVSINLEKSEYEGHH